VEALRPYGLTLQNYASVRDQQIGGFTQVSAHGTGATLPPVDEQVVAMRLVSPGLGHAVELEKGKGAVFDWVKVGLGAMGVATEFTLQCVDAHRLLEETTVTDRRTVQRNHKRCGSAEGTGAINAGALSQWSGVMQSTACTIGVEIHTTD
jgi:L-galactono-1,4-lactone dehydrogenase